MNYTLNEQLIQRIASTLGEMPARLSRHVLNELEVECSRQDIAEQQRIASLPKEGKE